MAPEAWNEYGLPADVYSFAILLWQIVTNRIPFESEINSLGGTIPKDLRPSLKYIESAGLQSLLQSCWAASPDDRLTFREIRTKLRDITDNSIVQPRPTKSQPKKQKKKGRLLRSSMFSR